MKTFLSMRSKLLLSLLLLFLTSFLLNSCRKEEAPPDEKDTGAPVVTASLPSPVLSIIKEFNRLEKEGPFMADMVRKDGAFLWERAVVMGVPELSGGRRVSGGDTIVLVPMAKPGSEMVDAFIVAAVGSLHVNLRIFRSNHYSMYGYTNTDNGLSADMLAVNFMMLNQHVFGDTLFHVKDNRLFSKYGGDKDKYIRITPRQHVNALMMPISWESCYTVFHEGDGGYVDGGVAPGGTTDYYYEEVVCTTNTIWVEVGGGGSTPPPPGGGGGGGGGGSGGGNPPPPCGGVAVRLPPGEDPCPPADEPGWTPAPAISPAVALREILGLSFAQYRVLVNDAAQAEFFYSLIQAEGVDEGLKASIVTTLDAERLGMVEGPYDAAHFGYVVDNDAAAGLLDPAHYWMMFKVKCAVLRQENPGWSKWRIYFQATWDMSKDFVHGALDIGGMVPVIGEICDLANGLIYAIEGDGVNAALSVAGAVPFVGWFATAAKYAKKTIFALDGTKRTLQWFKKANNLIDFGRRDQLREVIGLAKGDIRQAHHIIPWELTEHPIIQKIAGGKNGFHMNERYNGIALDAIQHNGSHNLYNNRVKAALDDIASRNLNDDDSYREVKNLIDRINAAITANPNTPVNNLIF